MALDISQFNPSRETQEIAEALSRDGVVIVTELIASDIIDELNACIQPTFDKQNPGGGDFMGNQRKAASRIFARGPEMSEHLLLNPVILNLADAILLPKIKMGPEATQGKEMTSEKPSAFGGEASALSSVAEEDLGEHCHHYKLNVAGATEIWGGGTNQPLHRENDIFGPYIRHDPAQPEYILFILVAGTDFSAENGATRLVMGSHAWEKGRTAKESEVSQAIMPKGSVVFWLGKTLHGLGANASSQPRKAFTFSFVVDWLATEENQLLTTPADVARSLPHKAQQLLGYRASPLLGWVAGRSTDNVLERAS